MASSIQVAPSLPSFTIRPPPSFPIQRCIGQASLHEGPHGYLELLAAHVVELGLYGLADLQLVLDGRHLQFSLYDLLPVHIGKPGVFSYRLGILLEAQSFLWVLGKQLLDQILKEFGRILGESDHSLADQLVQFLLSVGVVGRTAREELIEDDSVLIPVCHARVSLLVDDLERQVGRGAAEGLINCVQVVGFLGQPEISDERVSLTVQHYILWFQVTVYDAVLMQCLQTEQYLACVIPDLLLSKFLLLLQQPREITALAVVHHQEEVCFSLEGIAQSDYEGMVEQTQDVLLSLDVTVKISPIHSLLPDCFQCQEIILFLPTYQVDLSEGPLAYLLEELKGGKRDGLHALIFSDELVEFEDVLLPEEACVSALLGLSRWRRLLRLALLAWCFLVVHGKHLLNHIPVVVSIAVHAVLLSLLLLLVLPEQICKIGRGQVDCSHPCAIFYQRRRPILEQGLSDVPIAVFSCIMESSVLVAVPLIDADPR